MTLLIATTNAGKLREIAPVLEGLALNLVTLADVPARRAPEETGRTFAENARLKARYYAGATGLPTVADDSGLEIDALGGRPGVGSARLGGEDATYPQKFALIRDELRAGGKTGSPARFVCALALVRPPAPSPQPTAGDVLFEAEGTLEGQIVLEPRGDGGFGYDPIFFYAPFGCTLAEAAGRKATVSHRSVAFRSLRRFLETLSIGP